MEIIVAFKKSVKDDTEWYWKLAAKLVKFGTKSEFFHVETAIDDKWISANTSYGIEIHELKPINKKHYDYYKIEVPDLTIDQKEKFWRYINKQVGSGYDWKGIYLTQFIKLDWESESKWFCSEIVTKILQLLYVEDFLDKKPNKLSPGAVFEIINKIGEKIEIEK